MAKYAAEDLLFDEKDRDLLVERLKTLEQGICALNCIEGPAGKRRPASSLFISIPQVTIPSPNREEGTSLRYAVPEKTEMRIRVIDKEGKARDNAKIQVFFLGEKVHEGRTNQDGILEVENTIRDKEYKIALLGEKRKDTRIFRAKGGDENSLVI